MFLKRRESILRKIAEIDFGQGVSCLIPAVGSISRNSATTVRKLKYMNDLAQIKFQLEEAELYLRFISEDIYSV